MASSSSKVAALANMFQSHEQANFDTSHTMQEQSGESSGKKFGGSRSGGETPALEEKVLVESGIKHYKNNFNLRRTSSQVARFSSAKKVFEMKNKDALAVSEGENSRSPGISPKMSSTLPQRLCSPGFRSGSKIPIGEFWNDKKDKRLVLETKSTTKENNDDLMNKIITEKSAEILKSSSVSVSHSNTFPKPVKTRHLKKYESLTEAHQLESPVLNKAETQFTGLLDTLLSPEYRQAEQDFERIAEANISTDNLLEGPEKSVGCSQGLLDVDSKIQNVATTSQGERLQSTFKEFSFIGQSIGVGSSPESNTDYKASLDFEGKDSGESVKDQDKTSDLSAPGANASSLGSSLEGQTVSSWLATTTNTTDCNTTTDTTDTTDTTETHETDNSDLSKKMEAEGPVESSDYVSGDSCDFVTPKSSSGGADGVDVKLHFREDGHFWYEGSPLEIEDKRLKRIGSKVSFSTSPIKHFSTFSNEDYDRRNEDIDPETASAEYELEKRLEKMELITVNISKEMDKGVACEASSEKLGIFVKAIIPGGPVQLDGRIQIGDQLVSIDGKSLVGVNQFEAADILNSTGEQVEVIVGRGGEESGEDQVLQIIHQNNSTIEEESLYSQEDQEEKSSNELSLTEDGKKLFCFELDKVHSSVVSVEEECPAVFGSVKSNSHDNLPQIEDAVALEDSADDVEKVNESPEVEPAEKTKVLREEESRTESVTKPSVIVLATSQLSPPCCPYRSRYESLLETMEKSESVAQQLRRDLKTVTSELVSRDQTQQLYMDYVERLLDLDRKTDTSLEQMRKLEELRQKLTRPPHIPAELKLDLPKSDLDTVIETTQVLNCQPAKDRIRLAQRSLVPRRNTSSQRMSLTTPLDNLFRRNRMRCSLPIMSKVRSQSCSNSFSDCDAVSSASSVHSVPDSSNKEEQPTGKKKKSRSLLKNMKRRMSLSNYNKENVQ